MAFDVSLRFTKESRDCAVTFISSNKQVGADAEKTVCLNGRNYILQGAESDIKWLREQFPELNKQENISMKTLEERLSHLGIQNIHHETEGMVHVFATEKLSSQIQQPTGRVIIVGGHSTAGKTTIINAIMKLDPNQSELGIDITPPRSIYEYLEKNHTKFGVSKEDWQHLHDVLIPRDENYHIHDAVDEGQFQFRDGVSEIDKDRAKKTAKKLRDPCKKFIETLPHSSLLVMNKAHELAGSGKNVIMDTVNIDQLDNHPLENQGQITKVLVYCKLSALSNRLKQRTREALESGHPENVRAGTFPLHQYLEIFGPRKDRDKEDDVIDTVSRETVEQVIEEQFDAGIQDLKRRRPQEYSQKIADGSIAKEREEEKAKLLEAFGFTLLDPMHKTVQLTPRLQWTTKVDTSNNPPAEDTAKKILNI